MMTEKSKTKDVAFIETNDEQIKGLIEKAFLNNGISYLVKISHDKINKISIFNPKKKYAFYVNRFQLEQAEEVITEKDFELDKVVYL